MSSPRHLDLEGKLPDLFSQHAKPARGQEPAASMGTTQLLTQHRDLLEASAISHDVANARGYRSITDKSELEALDFKPYQCRVPALLIPVHGVNAADPCGPATRC